MDFLPNLILSQILRKIFFCLILALFIIFISSVGSKCQIIFYIKITGRKDTIETNRENIRVLKLNGKRPKNSEIKIKQKRYEIPEIVKETNMRKFILEIEVKIFKNWVKIKEVKLLVISSFVGPFWNPKTNKIMILA